MNINDIQKLGEIVLIGAGILAALPIAWNQYHQKNTNDLRIESQSAIFTLQANVQALQLEIERMKNENSELKNKVAQLEAENSVYKNTMADKERLDRIESLLEGRTARFESLEKNQSRIINDLERVKKGAK